MNLLRLKEVLAERNLTGKDFAERVDVSQNTISNIASGRNFPKPELLFRIAQELKVDIRELFHHTRISNETDILNGFIEHKGVVHKITSVKDLEDVLEVIKRGD